ncbi:metallophosphoesterase family protein [Neolewinella persica]|uniref:metallophosphoesterase family protein n=1 Tax=Neolewinella persica TaxID=70998 RepID=UPI00039F3C2E|nr:metallophosphoesterase [Neolewinella persica]
MSSFNRNIQKAVSKKARFLPIFSSLETLCFLCALLFSIPLSAQSWGAPKKDRCIGSGIATYSAKLANDGGKGWEAAAKSTSIRILGINQGTPDRTSNQGWGGMWGEWDIKDASCLPKWGAPKKDRCIGNGRATYSARLASTAGMSWEAAAKSTSILIQGVDRGRPVRTSNQGVGGMWGEWDIPDNTCTPKWGAAKRDDCKGNGIVQYSARLASDAGMGWEAAAKSTSITINGIDQGPPKRTSDQGAAGGMWGEWEIKDDTCVARWGAAKSDGCKGTGIVQYSARLASDAGLGWEAAAKSTSITINGIDQGPPKRTRDQGAAGGMWGEWDIEDNTCVAKWGTPKKDDCKGTGIVQYSARLASDAGLGWEAAAKSTSITINGIDQGPPKRTSDQGAAGGMWGEWDIEDDTCVARWGAAKSDGCKGTGIVQYSARLASDAGLGWEAAAKSTSIVINGVNRGTPTRTSDQGAAGMWGEWDIKDDTCLPESKIAKWGTWTKQDCTGSGKRTYFARLENTQTEDWSTECSNTPLTVNGIYFPRPDRCVDKGIAGMWGEVDLEASDCKAEVTLPNGYAVRLSEQTRTGRTDFTEGKGQSRILFEDGPLVYPNQTKFAFDKNLFSMAIMSDTQIGFCVSTPCKDIAGTSETANRWHIQSLVTAATETPNFAGTIINGDLTNVADDAQLAFFEEEYLNRGLNLYLGLGNHDYDNYALSWAAYGGNAHAANGRGARPLDQMAEHIKTIPGATNNGARPDLMESRFKNKGSYAYGFNIGKFHFLQLQNYPSYEIDLHVYRSGRMATTHFEVTKSLDWLEAQLKRIPKDEPVVLNMHAIDANAFHSRGNPDAATAKSLSVRDTLSELERSSNTSEDYRRFTEILSENPNVIAIFAGHLHERVGQYDYGQSYSSPVKKNWKVTLPGDETRTVPIFFGGAAEYMKYPLVKFDYVKKEMTVEVINSENGKFERVQEKIVVDFNYILP